MMQTGLAADQVTRTAKEFDFLCGRDMQDVKLMTMPFRQLNRSHGRYQSRLMVTNPTVIGHVVTPAELSCIGTHRGFIFAMGADRQSCLCKDPLKRLLMVNQQIPGTRANKDFDSGRSLCRLKHLQIVRGGTDVEAISPGSRKWT
jgi:hypothetical protein